MNQGLKWYVAHTYSGYENKVKTSLEKVIENRGLGDLICDINIPVEIVIEQKGEEQKEVEVKLFPSYVYIKMVMNDETWHAVRNIQGVTGFVGPGSRPTPLSDAEVRALNLEGVVETEETEHRVSLDFAVGDTVIVSSGLFEGYNGTVLAISDDRLTVTVLVKRGRRDMPVEIEASCLTREEA
ncbi:MAG: transcription termination/antitermination factor NusG [Clostridia bacterium]|nr:transcription termination/antitermination factor NusG [Clostridia bacterium]MBQ9098070.1 transcription termination/antitermination factor NusG [Clostridia bacterium]